MIWDKDTAFIMPLMRYAQNTRITVHARNIPYTQRQSRSVEHFIDALQRTAP